MTLPVDASLKGLSPSGLIEQPALLLKLVNERLDHLKAKVSWVEGARAERSRAGRLQAATRTVNKGLWWRLRGLPLLQRIFILVMLLAAALIFVDGGTAIAAADTAISSVPSILIISAATTQIAADRYDARELAALLTKVTQNGLDLSSAMQYRLRLVHPFQTPVGQS